MEDMNTETNYRERRWYGISQEAIDQQVQQAREDFRGGASMLVMSILSDAQEVMARGRSSEAERLINRAKYVADTYLVDREAK